MIETILLFLIITLAFFFPGWLLLRIFWKKSFSILEESLYALALGLTFVDILVLVLNRFHIPLSSPILITSLSMVIAIALGWLAYQKKHDTTYAIRHTTTESPQDSTNSNLSPATWKILLIMLAITIGIKAYYLVPAGLPTATDMGHHMYWGKYIAAKHELPVYQKIEVATDPATGATTVTPPSHIADFIIGEHIPFGVISILSGLSFFSSFPVLFLFLINILSLLAMLALTIRLGQSVWNEREHTYFIIGSFLFLGPLFTLASPQAKFVSGGVVGNLFGNFLIPLILLTLYLGLREKQSRLVALGLFLLGTLAYTHHLSTLVIGFILIGVAVIASLTVWRDFLPTFKMWLFTFLKPSVGMVLGGIILFLLFIAVPSYLDREAIDSALGSPVKTTRTGLSFFQVSNSLGLTKSALAMAGFVLLIFSWKRFEKRDPLAWSILFGWAGMLAVMTIRPSLLFLDIPSNRVGSYLVYPTALLAGFAFMTFFTALTQSKKQMSATLLSLLVLGAILANGIFENGASLVSKGKDIEAQEVFTASKYLSEKTSASDMILKDHNYLAADAWMKLFFVRDYGYPLSRGLFSRYEETGSRRERCTLVMIASPNSEEAWECFEGTGTNYIVVNPTFDAVQFEKSPDFAKVYASEHVVIFKRIE